MKIVRAMHFIISGLSLIYLMAQLSVFRHALVFAIDILRRAEQGVTFYDLFTRSFTATLIVWFILGLSLFFLGVVTTILSFMNFIPKAKERILSRVFGILTAVGFVVGLIPGVGPFYLFVTMMGHLAAGVIVNNPISEQ